MMKSKNFSGFAKAFYICCIFLCVGATTALIMMHAPKKTPEAAVVKETDEIQRGEDILKTYQESPENN